MEELLCVCLATVNLPFCVGNALFVLFYIKLLRVTECKLHAAEAFSRQYNEKNQWAVEVLGTVRWGSRGLQKGAKKHKSSSTELPKRSSLGKANCLAATALGFVQGNLPGRSAAWISPHGGWCCWTSSSIQAKLRAALLEKSCCMNGELWFWNKNLSRSYSSVP